jgi:uncharacterized membrane protein
MNIMGTNDEESGEIAKEGVNIHNGLFLLLIIGFVLAFVGIEVLLVATVLSSSGSASVGAIIFIGPFPIVIAAGPDLIWIVLFSIIIAVLNIMIFFIIRRRMSRL